MRDFIESFSLDTLAALRRQTRSAMAENNAEIVPGVYWSWDSDEAEVSIAIETNDWAALICTCLVSGTPRWLSLNLGLGTGVFEAGDAIGLSIEGYADRKRLLNLRLRSKIDGEIIDTPWPDAIGLTEANGVCTALHRIDASAMIAGKSGYHTLLLAMPPTNTALTLRNMRVFRVSEAQRLDTSRADLTLLGT